MFENYLGKSIWSLKSQMKSPITLREVVEEILKLNWAEGIIYVGVQPENFYSIAFKNGQVTYQSNKDLDLYRGVNVTKVNMHGNEKLVTISVFLEGFKEKE